MRYILATFMMFAASLADAQPTLVEQRRTVAATSAALVEDFGIETLGGVFTAIVERGCRVPCSTTKVFSTAEDGQAEIELRLVRGTAPLAKDNHSLGVYAVVGIPLQPRGMPSVAVTFDVSATEIQIEAYDNHTRRQLKIERRKP